MKERGRPVPLARNSQLATAAVSIPLPTPSIAKAIVASFILAFVAKFRTRIFYPGSAPDPSHPEPLPPGRMGGCPWLGPISMISNMNEYLSERSEEHRGWDRSSMLSNMNEYLSERAAEVNAEDHKDGALEPTRIWKMFSFGAPTAVISGSTKIKKMLGREFKKEGGGVSQVTEVGSSNMVQILFGTESMSSETGDVKKYHTLQRLVGQAMTPEAVARGVPFLQKCSEEAVDDMLAADTIVMADLFRRFTLDVAWRQIIGLKLKSAEEIASFRSAVRTWLAALTNYFLLLAPIPRRIMKGLPSYKAKMFLNEKIEERIDELERDGPDGTTMSAMVYATDEEDGTTKLTRQQIIDNTNLLLVAGSETSSLTLTNVMLLLGMHPGAWEKLVNEQKDFVSKYGDEITKEDLDRDCPYLDGVLRETMRVLPVSAGGARRVDDTVVMDGVQIPKGWFAMYGIALTHEQDPKTYAEDGSHMDIRRGFVPERWMDATTRPTTEYMPFGAGHRFCLGHTLAIAEMKTFLAILARKVKGFDLITDTDNLKWKEGVILTPKDGVVISAR
eukprot:CAMPEP_0172577634 /NCGR_PEP_ID=MMETSP1067-20121228/138330_1 /TAXON_ID=265564 ORGANISM="Thalassiosira punctigera, Strain Tpunct2005C2" /NCGR_SAMPLE_ID=MMETSP1067 /ASSEMBLY_ACC=CAM_ASM_000444 /LENGTH=558 /DNA_ID=CAMNT_0013370323 /DNA_START=204 /DNA_END=1879 /DNA_ORIENTATION=+